MFPGRDFCSGIFCVKGYAHYEIIKLPALQRKLLAYFVKKNALSDTFREGV